MRGVWTAAQIREAESGLLAALPEDALMRRAAHGLAVHAVRLLRAAGGVFAARVVLRRRPAEMLIMTLGGCALAFVAAPLLPFRL